MAEPQSHAWTSIVPVWALTAFGVVAVLVWAPRDDAAAWLTLCLGLAIVAGFVAQLATRRPPGFVGRITASIGGSVLLVFLAAVVVLLSRLSLNG